MPRAAAQIHGADNPPPDASVRERILETATRLFYREGIQAVGIQRLIDEAGIAKASLYAHFASKDDLVAAYLERKALAFRTQVAERLAGPRLGARAKLLRLFDLLIEMTERPDFRGCPFLNARSEVTAPTHPAQQVTKGQRDYLHELVGTLVRETGVSSPERLTHALLLLMDGATATALLDADGHAARDARWAAERLLDRG